MRVTRGIPAAAKSPVALTIGNFDGVHLGHRAMLDELARASKRLGVPSCVMIFEPQPREFFAPDKAPTRLTSLREKLEQLEACGVNHVHVCRFNYAFAQIAAHDFIERVLVRGLGVREGGKPLLEALDITVAPTFAELPSGWRAGLAGLSVRAGPATLPAW